MTKYEMNLKMYYSSLNLTDANNSMVIILSIIIQLWLAYSRRPNLIVIQQYHKYYLEFSLIDLPAYLIQ